MCDWTQAMSADKCVGSQAIILNILYDLKNPPLERGSALCEFFQALEERWTENHTDVFSDFCQVIEENDNYLCQGPEVPGDYQECSRIVEVSSFYAKNVRLRELGWLLPGPGEQPPEWQVRRLEQSNAPAEIGKGKIRGRKPIAWVTQTAALEKIRSEFSSRSEQASAIRNRLGLAHYRKGEILIEIKYHRETSENNHLKLKSPTFLDGCASDHYRHTPIYSSFRPEDGWGRTLVLETFEEGLPEAVHGPIDFGEGFTLRYIGHTLPLPPNEPYSSERGQEFLKSLPLWNTPSPEARVRRLIESKCVDALGQQNYD
jgi:hypothetical protein